MGDIKIDKINKFLLEKWDPIGISNTVGAEDEYFRYADEIAKIIQHSDTYEELLEYLWMLETEHMGLRGNKIKTEKFAQALFHEIKNQSP
jgi:hypothetical protein